MQTWISRKNKLYINICLAAQKKFSADLLDKCSLYDPKCRIVYCAPTFMGMSSLPFLEGGGGAYCNNSPFHNFNYESMSNTTIYILHHSKEGKKTQVHSSGINIAFIFLSTVSSILPYIYHKPLSTFVCLIYLYKIQGLSLLNMFSFWGASQGAPITGSHWVAEYLFQEIWKGNSAHL